ncbi:MAG TPA: hypothetical protein VGD54_11865, partial [Steroidobacteraceae bacterium]
MKDQWISMPPRIRFRSILLLFVGGLIVASIADVVCLAFSASPFTATAMGVLVSAGSWIAGYEMLAYDRGWPSLPVRFKAVPIKVLLMSGGAAIALVILIMAVFGILHWAGVKLEPAPASKLFSGGLSALPFVFIVAVIAAPAA